MSLNQCTFIGRLGADPEVKSLQSGDKVANLRLAVSERWKDKSTGEKREKTEWVSIVIWGALAGVAERFLHKGSQIFVQGKLQTRKWADQSGQDRYSTEVVLQGPQAVLQMLDGAKGDSGQRGSTREQSEQREAPGKSNAGGGFADDFDDDLPF